MSNQIEILIKLPADYFMDKTEFDFLSSFAGKFKDSFQRKLLEGAVEKALKYIELPESEVTQQEVKEKMIEILAERALEGVKDDR